MGNYNEVFPWLHDALQILSDSQKRAHYDALHILSDSQKRAHYDMYLLYQKKLMHMYSGQGSKLQIYTSQATAFKEMEVAKWLKWCRLTINSILTEKNMVVGSGYFIVFERDFYSIIHAAYYGPKIQSMELLPDVV